MADRRLPRLAAMTGQTRKPHPRKRPTSRIVSHSKRELHGAESDEPLRGTAPILRQPPSRSEAAEELPAARREVSAEATSAV